MKKVIDTICLISYKFDHIECERIYRGSRHG